MSFSINDFTPNLIDVFLTGRIPRDKSLRRAEFFSTHRVSKRTNVVDILPKGGVGAEIGVFTGLFSAFLLRRSRPSVMYFVDPWWEAFGEFYPDWGIYTDNGKLRTRTAYTIASERIAKNAKSTRVEKHVTYSDAFLSQIPDEHFDWVYLDSTHSYEGTKKELELLRPKMKRGALVAGDDWHDDPSHHHFGVSQAVNEAVAREEYKSLRTFPALQWAVVVA